MKTSIIFILSFFLALACSTEKNEIVNQNQPINKSSLNYTDFEKQLTVDMNYNQIIALFGQPKKDIGYGIHIYVYNLADSTEIWIGYTNKIIYARQLDANHLLINHLLK